MAKTKTSGGRSGKKSPATSESPALSGTPPLRYPLVDIWRGGAVMLMVIYHFCYDLVYFRLAEFKLLENPFWLGFRGTVVTLFLLIVGVSLHLATRQGIRWLPALKRLAWIGGGALLVTLASLYLFPQRYIFFGILHFIAVASLVGLFFVRYDWLNLFLGLILLMVGNGPQHPFFDQPALQWLGLMTHRPATEDYVPMLPWLGVVLCGIWLGKRLSSGRYLSAELPRRLPGARFAAWLGRHALAIYLLHQPLLFGLFYLVAWLIA